jgi:hypothetical protein
MRPTDDPATQLDAVLAMAGVIVPEEDRAALLRSFVTAREQVALLHAVEAARHEEPALVFSARVTR